MVSAQKPLTKWGESLIEIILAIALFGLILPTLIYAIGSLGSAEPRRALKFNAANLSEEAKTVLQQMANDNWNNIQTNGTYTLSSSNGVWSLAAVGAQPYPTTVDGWTRTVTIANATRDAQGNLIPAGNGVVTEGAMKLVTITVAGTGPFPSETATVLLSRHQNLQLLTYSTADEFAAGGPTQRGAVINPPDTSTGEDGSITVSSEPPPKPTSLVSWWTMDRYTTSTAGDANWIEDSGSGGNTASVYPFYGTAPTLTGSRYGKAISLNGTTQYLSILQSSGLTLTSSMSWEYVVKPTAASIVPVIQWVNIGLTPTPTVGAEGWLFQSGNNIYSKLKLGGTGLSTSLTAPSITKYNHVVMTYDKTTGNIRHYLDGVLQATPTPLPTFVPDTALPLRIGFGTSSYFAGLIDDVAVYNAALSDEEVTTSLYGTYTSPVKDFGSSLQSLKISADVTVPTNTNIKIRVAMRNADPTGSCPAAESAYTFVGPAGDGSTTDFFTASGGSISGTFYSPASTPTPVPTTGAVVAYFTNPARCLRYRVYLMSMNDYTTVATRPKLNSIQFIYAL